MTNDLETRVAELERRLDRIEPHVEALMPIGPSRPPRIEMSQDVGKIVEEAALHLRENAIPPVDRNAQQLASGTEVPEDCSHTKLKANGQQQDYVVLTPEERAKGFVRPVRRTYIHVGKDPVMDGIVLIKAGKEACGTRTTMGLAIAETYARDPKFYSGTFCCTCNAHRSLDEFIWEGTRERVGS